MSILNCHPCYSWPLGSVWHQAPPPDRHPNALSEDEVRGLQGTGRGSLASGKGIKRASRNQGSLGQLGFEKECLFIGALILPEKVGSSTWVVGEAVLIMGWREGGFSASGLEVSLWPGGEVKIV